MNDAKNRTYNWSNNHNNTGISTHQHNFILPRITDRNDKKHSAVLHNNLYVWNGSLFSPFDWSKIEDVFNSSSLCNEAIFNRIFDNSTSCSILCPSDNTGFCRTVCRTDNLCWCNSDGISESIHRGVFLQGYNRGCIAERKIFTGDPVRDISSCDSDTIWSICNRNTDRSNIFNVLGLGLVLHEVNATIRNNRIDCFPCSIQHGGNRSFDGSVLKCTGFY